MLQNFFIMTKKFIIELFIVLFYLFCISCKDVKNNTLNIKNDENYKFDKKSLELPDCKNNNDRSIYNIYKCNCSDPFFGKECEKTCHHGQLKSRFTKQCICNGYYKGEDCNNIICINGGKEKNNFCICPPSFTGDHCEIRTEHQIFLNANYSEFERNHYFTGFEPASSVGSGGSRFQRYNDQMNNEMFTRDISGTIFSLIMIIVLVVSMYLLMKHRMQARYLSRRPDLLGACNFGAGFPSNSTTSARRVELIPSIDDERHIRNFPFSSLVGSITNHFIPNDGGPPPYFPPGHRPRRNCDDILPPLPSYEDATKLPYIGQNATEQNDDLLNENRSSNNNIELRPRQTQSEINNLENNVPSHLTVQSCAINSRIPQEQNGVVRSFMSNNNLTGIKRKLSNQDTAFSIIKLDKTGNNLSSINKTQSLNEVSCLENETNKLKRPEVEEIDRNFVGTSNELHEIDENQRHTTV